MDYYTWRAMQQPTTYTTTSYYDQPVTNSYYDQPVSDSYNDPYSIYDAPAPAPKPSGDTNIYKLKSKGTLNIENDGDGNNNITKLEGKRGSVQNFGLILML